MLWSVQCFICSAGSTVFMHRVEELYIQYIYPTAREAWCLFIQLFVTYPLSLAVLAPPLFCWGSPWRCSLSRDGGGTGTRRASRTWRAGSVPWARSGWSWYRISGCQPPSSRGCSWDSCRARGGWGPPPVSGVSAVSGGWRGARWCRWGRRGRRTLR